MHPSRHDRRRVADLSPPPTNLFPSANSSLVCCVACAHLIPFYSGLTCSEWSMFFLPTGWRAMYLASESSATTISHADCPFSDCPFRSGHADFCDSKLPVCKPAGDLGYVLVCCGPLMPRSRRQCWMAALHMAGELHHCRPTFRSM